jgi:hypothetical protein
MSPQLRLRRILASDCAFNWLLREPVKEHFQLGPTCPIVGDDIVPIRHAVAEGTPFPGESPAIVIAKASETIPTCFS